MIDVGDYISLDVLEDAADSINEAVAEGLRDRMNDRLLEVFDDDETFGVTSVDMDGPYFVDEQTGEIVLPDQYEVTVYYGEDDDEATFTVEYGLQYDPVEQFIKMCKKRSKR